MGMPVERKYKGPPQQKKYRLHKIKDERLPLPLLRYQTMDAGYDYEPIYEQVHRM
jgi:hypothetical protein